MYDMTLLLAFQKAYNVFIEELKANGYGQTAEALKSSLASLGVPAAPSEGGRVIPFRTPPATEAFAAGVPVGVATALDATAATDDQIAARIVQVIGDDEIGISEIAPQVGDMPVSRVRKVLGQLVKDSVLDRTGEKRGTKYKKATTLVNNAALNEDDPEAEPQEMPEEAGDPELVPARTRKKKSKKKTGKKTAAKKEALPNSMIEVITAKLQVDDGIMLDDLSNETGIPEKALAGYVEQLIERGIIEASDPEEDEEGDVFYYLAK